MHGHLGRLAADPVTRGRMRLPTIHGGAVRTAGWAPMPEAAATAVSCA